MKLTPQIEFEGLRAYEQVRAFERLRSWRLPLSYLFFSMIPMMTGIGFLKMGHTTIGEVHLVTALFFVACSFFHWHWLLKRYARNLQLLATQEQVYGDQLPWVKVERHLAQMDRLKRDLERGKNRRGAQGREGDGPPAWGLVTLMRVPSLAVGKAILKGSPSYSPG